MSKQKSLRKPWHKPVVTRIKLNPEQAVLSCCDQYEKIPPMSMVQCFATPQVECGGGGVGQSSSSS